MKSSVLAPGALSAADRDAMCTLLDRHFLGVEPAGFAADLADKTHVLRLEDDEGALCGFTTFALTPSPLPGAAGWVIFSGDTIVDEGHRSSAALAAGWIDAVEQLRESQNIERLIWLLICSSVRTYRFLPLFFREFAPHPSRATDPAVRAELDQLATWRYGQAYDAARGLVILPRPQPLRTGPLDLPRADSELARFFEAANPGHRQGDELVCHCQLADTNLTPAGRRMVETGRRRRLASAPVDGR